MNGSQPEHLVLIGPIGKRAGVRKQHIIACKLHAINLCSVGHGGGIADLLLPKNKIELEKLRKYIRRRYKVKKVTIRRNPSKIVREAIKSNQLMVALAEKFLAEKGTVRRAMAAPVREFSNWICLKLTDKNPNQVKNIVYKAHPNLVDRTSPDWWRKQIAERKK
jgi:hypothetical protein